MTTKGSNGKSMQCIDHAPSETAEGAINAEAMLESTRVWQWRKHARDAHTTVIAML